MASRIRKQDPLLQWFLDGLKGQKRGIQRQLAEALNADASRITEIKNGRRRIQADEVPIIAAVLKIVPPPWSSEHIESAHILPAMPNPTPWTKIVGYVGASGKGAVNIYDIAPGELEQVDRPHFGNDRTVAVVIRGDSLGVSFKGWLAFYDDVRSPVTPDQIGELCVVGIEGGGAFIKKLVSRPDGRFDLMSNTGKKSESILGAKVEWAAVVKGLLPR